MTCSAVTTKNQDVQALTGRTKRETFEFTNNRALLKRVVSCDLVCLRNGTPAKKTTRHNCQTCGHTTPHHPLPSEICPIDAVTGTVGKGRHPCIVFLQKTLAPREISARVSKDRVFSRYPLEGKCVMWTEVCDDAFPTCPYPICAEVYHFNRFDCFRGKDWGSFHLDHQLSQRIGR